MQPFLILMSALAIGMLLALVLLIRQQSVLARQQEQLRHTETHIGEMNQLTQTLLREVERNRVESASGQEHSRLRAAGEQAQNLEALQSHLTQVLGLTHKQMEDTRQSVDVRLTHLTGHMTKELGDQNRVMLALQGQLGSLSEAAKQIEHLGRDISGLQDILRAPKLRGNLGEMLLAEILRQVLPRDSFDLQYRFSAAESASHVTVDAVIRLGAKLVPIDSKFPLESFRRLLEEANDVGGVKRRAFLEVIKGHIDVVADKYIRPDEGTYDFAIAYLPAENVYYEAVVRDGPEDGKLSVMAHAAARKVILCSPNTMYAYLLTVAYGLKGMRIGEQAEAIRNQLQSFHKKFGTFFSSLEKVGRNLDLAKRGFDDASKRGEKLQEQMERMSNAALELEVEVAPSPAPTGLPPGGAASLSSPRD